MEKSRHCRGCKIREGAVIRRRRSEKDPNKADKKVYKPVRAKELKDYKIETLFLPPERIVLESIGNRDYCWVCAEKERRRQALAVRRWMKKETATLHDLCFT